MPKFTKEILPEGEYLVTRQDGSRMLKSFNKEYLKTVADNAMKMLDAGLRIPAPFRHHRDAQPVEEGIESDSYNNAGYWEEVSVKDVDGIPTLCGVVDVPGDPDDANTPAGKLTHTVKEVSACIQDSWTDGKGRNWGPCLLHGAPVLHPVVPGQKEFSILEEAFALSVSGMVDQSPSSETIGELSKALEESVGVYLPPSTLPDDLVKVLLVSLKQHKMTADQTVDDQEIVDTQSIFMSLPEGTKMPLTKAQAEEIVKIGALNPKTKEPLTFDDFEIDDTPSPESQYALALTGQLTEEKKGGLRKRVTDLITSGRTTKEYAEKKLFPEIDNYELSLGDGATFKPNAIDLLVDSLEALPAKEASGSPGDSSWMSSGIPHGQTAHDGSPGADPNNQLSEEDAEKMKKAMLQQLA